MVGRGGGEQPPQQPTAPGQSAPWEPAPLPRRFGALLVDWILCVLVASLFADPRRVAWPPVAVLIGEYGFFLGLFGQTPGMWVTRLRCVSVTTAGPIGIPRALLRGFLLALFIPALLLDGERRGWHDKAAGSIVVAAAASAPVR
jgi:uncharacterized RDD family membrane protein YckC